MKNKIRNLFCIVLPLICVFLCIGYAKPSDSLAVSGSVDVLTQEGVFITDVAVPVGEDVTVHAFVSTVLTSTVNLGTDGSSTVTFSVNFYNNTNSTYIYDGVTYESDAYSNKDIVFSVADKKNFITPHGTLKLDITFSYDGSTASSITDLYSVLKFNFTDPHSKAEDPDGNTINVSVVDGNSADNIGTLADGGSKLNYDDTNYRWTNWVSNSAGVGIPATLNLIWDNEKTFDSVTLYHFVDTGGSIFDNWKGASDFPESVQIYYYDEAVGDYVELTPSSETKNYSGASRSWRNGVYTMTIDGARVTLDSSYNGTAPATTYTFANEITTSAVKIVLTPQSNYYVGLTEIEFNNN